MDPRTPHLGTLGVAIERARKAAGLSQEALGQLCGMHGTQISGFERGARNPTYETLIKVAAVLDTSVGQITTVADELYDALPPAKKQ